MQRSAEEEGSSAETLGRSRGQGGLGGALHGRPALTLRAAPGRHGLLLLLLGLEGGH